MTVAASGQLCTFWDSDLRNRSNAFSYRTRSPGAGATAQHRDKTVPVGGQRRFLSQYQKHMNFRITIRNEEMC